MEKYSFFPPLASKYTYISMHTSHMQKTDKPKRNRKLFFKLATLHVQIEALNQTGNTSEGLFYVEEHSFSETISNYKTSCDFFIQ